MLHVGQQVVCVDDDFGLRPDIGEVRPVKGIVYTIRDIHDGNGLLLEEIINEPRRYREGLCECDFYSWRFRPVRKTSIEIFERMLTQVPRKESV